MLRGLILIIFHKRNPFARNACLKKNRREIRFAVCGMSRECLEKVRTSKTEQRATSRFNFKEAITPSSHDQFLWVDTTWPDWLAIGVYTGKHVFKRQEKKTMFARRRKCRFCARPARVTLEGSSTCSFAQAKLDEWTRIEDSPRSKEKRWYLKQLA